MSAPTDITALVIDNLHRQFLKDKNPLHVWQAYQWSRRPPRPLPDWIAAYFDAAADALLYGTPPDTKRSSTPTLSEMITFSATPPAAKPPVGLRADKALGLATRGGHSKHRQLANDSRDIGIFSILDARMQTTRDDLPDDEDLTPDERAQVKRWFAPTRRGETKLGLLCRELARETRRRDNGLSATPLSAATIQALYFRLKRQS